MKRNTTNELKEEFLHFIWVHNLFHHNALKLFSGERIEILNTGINNPNQGPDFLNASIRIDKTVFYGNIEIHIHNRDWYQHKHHIDKNYNTTILHVVYYHENDLETLNSENCSIPILCLEHYIEKNTLKNILTLINDKKEIPCLSIYQKPNKVLIEDFKTRIFCDRVVRKSGKLKDILIANKNNYENSFYQSLLYGFGIPVNSEYFLEIAHSIPQKIISKYIDQHLKLEALVLGQANLIQGKDEYSIKLLKEYTYLKQMHQLKPIHLKPNFSRMMPSSFPTIRLIQFVGFIYKKNGLYSKLISSKNLTELHSHFQIEVSDYWKTHYDLNKINLKPKNNQLSKSFIEKIIINIILPFRFLIAVDQEQSIENIIEIYYKLKSETNRKTKIMCETINLENNNAFDSQALNEWYSNYCLKKRCLHCPIGVETLRNQYKTN